MYVDTFMGEWAKRRKKRPERRGKRWIECEKARRKDDCKDIG